MKICPIRLPPILLVSAFMLGACTLGVPLIDDLNFERCVGREQDCGGSGLMKPRIPVRDILLVGQEPKGDAYGIVVFLHKPEDHEKKKYKSFCESFSKGLPPDSKLGREIAAIKHAKHIITYWPINAASYRGVDKWDCDFLIKNYNLDFGLMHAAAINRLDAEGPLIIGWARNRETDATGTNPLVLDMSLFDWIDLHRAVGIWRDRITRDPAAWNSGMRLQLAREKLRFLLNRYGSMILSILPGAEVPSAIEL